MTDLHLRLLLVCSSGFVERCRQVVRAFPLEVRSLYVSQKTAIIYGVPQSYKKVLYNTLN
jgi:hypothetical protein